MEARARFLNSASHLYAGTAPATSAHLMLQCNILEMESDRPNLHKDVNQTCKACGTIDIHVRNTRVILDSRVKSFAQGKKRRRARRRPIGSTPAKYIQIQCRACERFTRHDIPLVPPERTAGSQLAQFATLNSPLTPEPKPGKRRPKNRSHGSLQLLLARSKEEPSGVKGYGLDFLDLMKKD